MKYLFQLAILMMLWAAGEVVSILLSPFISIPGSILGMLILFFLLSSGVIKEHHIQETSDFLLNNIAFFFVPASIGVVAVFSNHLLLLFIIAIISTIVTMLVTMFVTQFLTKGGH